MKMKKMVRKITAFFMMLVMLISLFADWKLVSVQAADDALEITSCDVLIGGVPYTSGMTVKENTTFTVTVSWLVKNGAAIGDRIEIALPDCIDFTPRSNQTAYADGFGPIGTYSVVDGKLVMIITEEEIKTQSNLKGGFVLEGTLNESVIPENSGETTTVNIFNKSLVLKVTKDESLNRISVDKKATGSYDPGKGQRFDIVITSTGNNEKISITDYYDTSALEMNGSISVTSTDGTTVGGTYQATADGFTYQFPSDFVTKNGAQYTLSYYLKIKDGAYESKAGEWQQNSVNVKTKLDDVGQSDSDGFRINKTWISKSGMLNSDGTVSWTIKVNEGDKLDIGQSTFTDVLPDDFTLSSDVTISGSDGSTTVLSKEEASSGISYVFPSGSAGSYTITYQTTVNLDKIDGYNPIVGAQTAQNVARLVTPKYGTHEKGASVYIGGIGSILKKSDIAFRLEDTKGIITWQSTITVPDPAECRLTDFSYSDEVENYWGNQKMLTDSIVVKLDGVLVDASHYTMSTGTKNSNDTFTLDFQNYFESAAKDSKITITYDTVFELPAEGATIWPKNTGTISVNGSTQSSTDTYTYTNIPAITKNFKGVSKENTVFTWYLTINLENSAITNPVYVTDYLPENHKLVEDSIRAMQSIWYDPSPSANGITQTGYDAAANSVTFRIDTENVRTSNDGKQIYLLYETQIDDMKEFLSGTTNSYINRVVIEDESRNKIGESKATASGITPSTTNLLQKNFTYNIYTAPFVDYTIDVNTTGLTLLNGVDKLELTDVIGSAMVYVPGSLVIYTDSARTIPMETSLYSVSYSVEENTLRLILPDATPCYISYRTKVLLEYGDILNADNASNIVSLDGKLANTVENSTSLNGVVLRSSAYVISENGTINLYKHDSLDQSIPVPDASYTAVIKYYYDYITGEVKPATDAYLSSLNMHVSQGGKYDPDKKYVTDSDGNVTIPNIYYDFLYEIKEYSAPNGYQLNKEPLYYYIVGLNHSDFSSLEAEGIHAVAVTSGNYIYVEDTQVDKTLKTISISKRMSGTGSDTELSGAELKLTYMDGGEKTFATWTSSSTPKEFTVSTTGADESALKTGVVYTLTEISAPTGFAIAESIEFTVDENGLIHIQNGKGSVSADEKTLIMQDARMVSISKIADYTGNMLEGAHLALYDASSMTVITEWDSSLTPENFVISETSGSGKLETGKEYLLREVTAPANYKIAEDIRFIIENDGQITITNGKGSVSADGVTLYMADKELGAIEITKVDAQNTSKVLSGAVFELYDAADTGFTNLIASKTTGSDGKCTFDNLAYGNYVVRETTAPLKYEIISADTKVTLNSTTKKVTITNSKIETPLGKIVVTKKDSVSGDLLAGAKFTLSNVDGMAEEPYTATSYTDDNGKIIFENVPYGEYKLEETEAPFGYKTIPYDMTGSSGVTYGTGNTYCIVLLNATTVDTNKTVNVSVTEEALTGSLKVIKKDSQTGALLSNARFALYDETGTTKLYPGGAAYQETNASGEVTFSDIPYGNYILREIEAPAYYQIDVKDTPVTINSTTLITKTITNTRYKFYVGKTAVDDNVQLAGATLYIAKAATPVPPVISWTTTTDVKEIYMGTGVGELEAGDYVLVETAAPSGYEIAPSVSFHVDEYGKITTSAANATVSSNQLTLTLLEKHTGSIKITKLDAEADPGTLVHQPLENATFQLYNAEDTGFITPLLTGNTNEFGTLTFDHLPYGTYVLKETTAPTGYKIIVTDTTVVLNEDVEEVTIYNVKDHPDLGKIIITKVDSTDSAKKLAGAVFNLFYEDTFIASATTNKDGIAEFHNIPYKNGYRIREVTAPVNYKVLSGDIVVDVTTTTVEKTIPNELLRSELTITKKSSDGTLLSGAKFEIYDITDKKFEHCIQIRETDADGKAVFDLPYGTYIVKEVQAPKYHIISEEQTKIVLDEPTEALTITNERLSIQISKKAENGTSELGGASLELYDNANQLIHAWTTTSAPLTFSLGASTDEGTYTLAPGTYVLKEMNAPAFYQLADAIKFKIDNDGTITILSGGTAEKNLSAEKTMLTMFDAPGANVVLNKVDAVNTDKVLQGAEFGIYKKTDTTFSNPIQKKITDASGKIIFENLPYGEYVIHEIKAPDGYLVITENIPVTVNAEKEDTFHNVTLAVSNNAQVLTADIQLTKADAENMSLKLAGAEFELYDSMGTYIASATTDTAGMLTFKNVKYGKYIIKEVAAPAGYGIDEDNQEITVTVNETTAGTGNKVTITVYDTKLKGSIQVKKVDSLSGNPLSGAEFELYDETDTLLDTKSSNEEGICLFENLLYGTYRVVETKAPENYILASVSEEIIVEKPINPVTIENTAKTGNLKITKTDYTNEELKLPGAVYDLFDEDGNKIATGTTGSDGSYEFKNIVYGNYYLLEQKAPEHYEIDMNRIDVVINDENVDPMLSSASVRVSDKKSLGNLTIVKRDVAHVSLPVTGAEFEVYDSLGNKIAGSGGSVDTIWTTDANGKITITNLPYGTYQIKEVNAPAYYHVIQEETSITINKAETEKLIYNRNTEIQISKRAINSTEELSGASLTLTDTAGNVILSWISGKEAKTIGIGEGEGQILPGNHYILTETNAPTGYLLAENILFTINETGEITLLSENGASGDKMLIMYDAMDPKLQPTSVKISKKAVNDTNELPGAALVLRDSMGKDVLSWISSETPQEITVGMTNCQIVYDCEYSLTELTAPSGYLVAETIRFKVGLDGKLILLGESGEISSDGKTLTMRDAAVIDKEPEKETEDEPEEDDTPDGENTVGGGIDTGDRTPLLLLAVVLLISLAVIIILFIRSRKKDFDEHEEEDIEHDTPKE